MTPPAAFGGRSAPLPSMSELSDAALLRYSRHLLLPEIDLTGQAALAASRVLVVGAGGLGSPVVLYLAAAGIGTLTVADADTVALSNLQRQIAFAQADLGRNKAEAAAERARALNDMCQVVALDERLQAARLTTLVAAQTLVLDCSDNFATRHAVNRACFAAGVPLVSGAAVRTEGQLAVFDPANPASPCYQCLFPDEGDEGDGPCATFGVLAPLVGVLGSLQAVEAVKWLVGERGSAGRFWRYAAWSGHFSETRVPRDPDCPVCRQRS
ncbi:HesA/MoeB/ThiF family protein [Gulbenkiania mobilis]|uniref:HesA/MoeB/ThiF family protein n=1 Tax=Gulbenkiania mobilis TaxID=397457 RepID=UPI000AF7931B|nr:molybdopterin-synthase adenylyltransferase MoeB [Gulbenkiania mobilis]